MHLIYLLRYCVTVYYIHNIMTFGYAYSSKLRNNVKTCVQHMYGKLLFDEQYLTLYLFLICMYCIVYSSLAFHLFVYCDSLINRLNRANKSSATQHVKSASVASNKRNKTQLKAHVSYLMHIQSWSASGVRHIV